MRPPPQITAEEFFSSWLPQAFAAAGDSGPGDAALVRVTLSGPKGGSWQVRAAGSDLVVRPGTTATRGADLPDAWIRQSAEDFLAVFRRDPDLPELLPEGFSALDLLFLDPRDLDLLRQIAGRILIEVEGKRRRRWALDLAIGRAGLDAGRPRSTVKITGAAYEGIARGQMAPLEALLGKRITIEGDRTLAMQALLLMAARLGRS